MNFLKPLTISALSLAMLPSLGWAISFDELQSLQTPHQVIDTRDSASYNGWQLGDATDSANSGHFPGAIRFDPAWFRWLDDEEKQALLDKYKLAPNVPTYVYGDDAKKLQDELKESKFSKVEVIEGEIQDYQGQKDRLANYQDLVPAVWVHDLIKNKPVPHPPSSDYKIIEVGGGPATTYLLSHIPGAFYMDTNELEAEPVWNKKSDAALTKALKTAGIAHDTSVILYGRDQLAAARAASILMYAGVEDVRILDGGMDAWIYEDFEREALRETATEKAFGKPIAQHPEYYIDLAQAKDYLKDPQSHSLVSIRSWPEYTGETSGYDYIEPKGRIPGSKWGHAGSDANHMEDFHNPDQTMISPYIIEKNWQEWNINKDQQVAFYCGTGWRAAAAFFYAHVLGWQNISIYDGGWLEWSMDKNNPTQTGDVTNKI